MPAFKVKSIDVINLQLDTRNPRHASKSSQRDTIAAMAEGIEGPKLFNLAQDIVERGLSPNDLPIVTPGPGRGKYIVLEGNRRVAALKLLNSPELAASIGLPAPLAAKFKKLAQSSDTIPDQVACTVSPAPGDAKHWIHVKHTGQNDGVGVVSWDATAIQRFRGNTPSLQVSDLVEHSGLLDAATIELLPKISISNVERVIQTPGARKLLGIDIRDGQVVFTAPDTEVMGRLAALVRDIAHGIVDVNRLRKVQDRVDYAKEILTRPIVRSSGSPTGSGGQKAGQSTGQNADQKAGSVDATAGKQKIPRKQAVDRKMLVPRSCKLAIKQARLNQMYDELQKLNIDDYTNSCAVMLRVFVEQSVDHFAKVKKIKFELPGKTPKPCPSGSACPAPSCPSGGKCPAVMHIRRTPKPESMTLRQKILAVADYLETEDAFRKPELQGIRSLCANRHHVLSVDSLNAYVHNKDYSPTPTDLKANWDSIQSFVELIWA